MFLKRLPLAIGCALALSGAPAQADDAEIRHGERVFRTQCAGCHSTRPDDHRAGPSLYDVVGRTAGEVPGFDFSPALQQAEFTWTGETLDSFLTEPAAMLPGTQMVFWGLDDQPRSRVIRYLETLSDDPLSGDAGR